MRNISEREHQRPLHIQRTEVELDRVRQALTAHGRSQQLPRRRVHIVDLRRPLDEDVRLEIVTTREAAGGEVIRHSAEHVMADAVKRLFPSAQVDAAGARALRQGFDAEVEQR